MAGRFYTYIDNGYQFKCYFGNWQKLKYDSKKQDYFLTYYGRRFYTSECINKNNPYWSVKDAHDVKYNVIGTWQEGYSVYELQTKDDSEFYDDSICRIVYCPPSSNYVGK